VNPWRLSWRADPVGKGLADRHYNRQNPESPQYVPPGRCLVLRTPEAAALWVSSWPIADYVQHAWAGAWVNSTFRNEHPPNDHPCVFIELGQDCPRYLSSALIAAAVAATRSIWQPPPLGFVTFIDASKTRRKRDPGRCYRRAGWTVVGATKGGLVALQQLPQDMPDAEPIIGAQMAFDLSGDAA
jgi:hypothetical protein